MLAAALFVAIQSAHFVLPTPPGAVSVQQDGAFDIYRPAHRRTESLLPVLIVFSAFGGADMRHGLQFEGWGRAAAAHGFVVIVAENLDSAADYLLRHAAPLQADTAGVGVMAWSAHAGVGMPLIEDPARTWIKAAVFYYGAASVPRIRLDLPVLQVRAGLDQPATNALVDAATTAAIVANAPWTVINYPAGHHGFDASDDNAESREIIVRTLAWLRSALSDSGRAAQRLGLAEAEAAGAASRGDYADAAVRFVPLVAGRASDARLALAYANVLLGAKRYHEAREQYDRAKALGGLGARDLGVPAARASALDGDPDAAIAWLRSIPSQFLPDTLPRDPAFRTLAGRADFEALFRK
jgi:dienelactone hydrolase